MLCRQPPFGTLHLVINSSRRVGKQDTCLPQLKTARETEPRCSFIQAEAPASSAEYAAYGAAAPNFLSGSAQPESSQEWRNDGSKRRSQVLVAASIKKSMIYDQSPTEHEQRVRFTTSGRGLRRPLCFHHWVSPPGVMYTSFSRNHKSCFLIPRIRRASHHTGADSLRLWRFDVRFPAVSLVGIKSPSRFRDRLYWIGPLEAIRPKVLPWFFHRDLLMCIRRPYVT